MKPFVTLTLALLLTAGCAATVPLATDLPDRSVLRQPVPADVAHIYVVRPRAYLGSALLFSVTLDGVPAGQLANATYFVFPVAPGPHTLLVSSAENVDRIPLTVQGGQAYFFRTTQRMGMAQSRVGLQPMDAQDGQQLVAKSRLAQRLDQ